MSLTAVATVEQGAFTLDVAIEAHNDENIVVLGPNGAGKSTLLRAIAGLVPLTSGRVVIDDRAVDDVAQKIWIPPEQRHIGVVFQDGLLFPHLSVFENVAFGLRASGRSRSETRRVASEWLERLEIAPLAAKKPTMLSGGQAQRVALARALAPGPQVLLLDEPLSALDATGRAELRRVLRKHLAATSRPRLLVTHDPIEAFALADRVIVIEDGRVVQSGTPAELRARPRTRYVADVVGVNMVRGVATKNTVTIDRTALFVPDPPAGEVFVTFHPRAVSLYRTAPEGSPRNVWEARVRDIDPEGERTRVVLDGPLPLVAEVTTAAVAALHLVENEPVWVALKATEITAFPA